MCTFPIYIVQTEQDSQSLKNALIKNNGGSESEYGEIVYEDCKIENLSYQEFVNKIIEDSGGKLKIVYMFRKKLNLFDILTIYNNLNVILVNT